MLRTEGASQTGGWSSLEREGGGGGGGMTKYKIAHRKQHFTSMKKPFRYLMVVDS